ncbi:MAG: hypothetical protein R3C28_28960 [Pirellulaceae bacterium]
MDALIDRVFAEFDINTNIRVCATGMSAGGMMAYRFACESVRRISAVCSVAGPAVLRPLVPRYPTPVLHFHGTDDEFTPYAGGVGAKSLSRIHFPSVEDTIAAWVAANGCDRQRTEELLQRPTLLAPSSVLRSTAMFETTRPLSLRTPFTAAVTLGPANLAPCRFWAQPANGSTPTV